jgi:hypothetical protein
MCNWEQFSVHSVLVVRFARVSRVTVGLCFCAIMSICGRIVTSVAASYNINQSNSMSSINSETRQAIAKGQTEAFCGFVPLSFIKPVYSAETSGTQGTVLCALGFSCSFCPSFARHRGQFSVTPQVSRRTVPSNTCLFEISAKIVSL